MPTFDETYTLGDELGKGAYAVVYRCTHKERGDQWAVKVVDKSKAGPKDISDVQHEVNMMKTIGHHNHVVQMLEFFDTPKYMYIVMEILEGGMLFDRIVKLKHYSEQSASRLVKNFLLALEHIHSKNICHRDLKPENLLLKKSEKLYEDDISHLTDVAIADFGLSGKIPGQTCCGSPSYIAPEVIEVGYLRSRKEPYDAKCDVWSLGVITYILLSGKMPFHGRNFKETFTKIVKGQWSFVGDIWGGVSPAAKDFIKAMLIQDPRTRPSAAEALKHPWVANVQSDLHLMASVDNLKQFNAQQKLRGAMLMFRATTSFLGTLDQTPPFLKYLNHKNKLSTVIECQSQTDKTKTHYVDFSRAMLRDTPGFKLQDCCTCGSSLVCRHIQNVHEYLFIGRRDMDVQPFINELYQLQDEVAIELEDEPANEDLKNKQQEIEEIIKAAAVFAEEYAKVPREMMKANLMLQSASTGPSKATLLGAFKKK